MSDDGRRDDRFRRDDVEIPRGGDLARQLVIVGLVVVAWFGTFDFAMNLPTETADSARAEARRAERIRAAAAADSAAADSTRADAGARVAMDAPADADPPEAAGGGEATSSPDAPVPTAATSSGSTSAGAAAAATSSPEVEPPTAEPIPPETDPVRALEEAEAMANLPDVSDHRPVSFEADVMPILEARCLQCHGAPRDDGTLRIEEGLDMRTHEAILAGSTWGSVVEPGDPVGSYMIELIVDGEMPDEGPRLLPREVRILTAWVAQGAPDN